LATSPTNHTVGASSPLILYCIVIEEPNEGDLLG
jgi:hypothetical protein